MKNGSVIEELKKLLAGRFPRGYNYIPHLADILRVHPKTVFRKLKGETQFTLEEAIKISQKLDIPMESLFNKGKEIIKHPMEIYFQDFSVDNEYQEVMKLTLQAFTFASDSASSVYRVATNTIPDVLYARHEWIARFHHIKWLYFNKGISSMVRLSDIVFGKSDKEVFQTYERSVNAFKRSIYILHIDMMKHIAEELLFFYQMKFLSGEEVRILTKEYALILDEFETICEAGILPDTGKEIEVFYSTLLLNNEIVIVDSDNLKFAIIYAYFLNPIVTKTKETFKIIKEWFHAWMRSSNIISMSGMDKRIQFFSKQRADLRQVLKILPASP